MPTKRVGRCRRSSTSSPPVTMPSRSSRVMTARFTCLPTSTRTGKRPPTSFGLPRTPGVSSTHTNRSSRTPALDLTALQGRWKVLVSKSVTKEPRCRQLRRRNVGIIRVLLIRSALFQAFVTDLDTIGRLVGEDGGLLGFFSGAGSTCARSAPCQLAECEHRSRRQNSPPCGLRLTANSLWPVAGWKPPTGIRHPAASPIHGRTAPPGRTALRGGTRRRPTPQSVLRAGSSRLIAYSVLRATSPQQQVAANNRDTRKAQDQ